MRLNIGIDGPVGAGKSSVADAVAARLGILHLDTGAMYRALGLTALRRGIDTQDEQAIVNLCLSLKFTVSHEADGQHTYVDGEDVTGEIRTPDVSMAASTVSRYASPQSSGSLRSRLCRPLLKVMTLYGRRSSTVSSSRRYDGAVTHSELTQKERWQIPSRLRRTSPW